MIRSQVTALALIALFAGALFAGSAASAGGQSLYEIDVNDARDVHDLLPPPEPQPGDDAATDEDEEIIELDHEIEDDDFPRSSLSAVVFGNPTLVDGRNGRALRLDSRDAGRFYEQVRLDLGLATPGRNVAACGVDDHALFVEELDSNVLGYDIDIEFVVNGLSFFGPNRNFSIFFDGTSSLTRVDFSSDGEILLYDGQPDFLHLGNYFVGKPISLQAHFDYTVPSLVLVVNDEEIHFEESEALGKDLRSLRLSLGLGRAVPPPYVDIKSIRIDSVE